MKILYFHQHFITNNGNGGTRSYEIAKRCITSGHKVIMVCGSVQGGNTTGLVGNFKNGKRTGIVDGINIIEYNLKYSNNTSFLSRIFVFIQYALKSVWLSLTIEYDVVFATSTPLTAGIPGIAARWFRGKKFVFEVRDLWPELPKAMGVIKNPLVLCLMSLLEWVTYKSASKLVGLSPGICDGIIKRGVPKENVKLISNGCDNFFFSNREALWIPEGIERNDLLLIYSGTLGIANGLDAVLDAVKVLVNRKISGYKILIIGDGRLKSDLINRAEKEFLLDNILFHEPISKKKLAGLLQSCDIGLQILANVPEFYYGTSPNKFFDYISAGLPVLCNYPGWVADIITENNCGFYIQPDNPIDFANKIIELIERKDDLITFGRNAKKIAIKDFDRDILALHWIKWVLN